MPQQIVIAEQLRIAALLTDERVDELIVAQGRYQIGDVFFGTVENVLPGIDAAFVNIGESEKNGFIHVSDLGPLRLKKGSACITELLEPRQKVMVQVMKEPTGSKGPRLTGNLSLPGRYLVLQPNGQGVNISRRISAEGERNRLRALGILVKPPGSGLLIRTEANGISEEFLIDDLEHLLRQWEEIQIAAETANPPVLLNRDEDFIHRILRDHTVPNLARIVVDNQAAVEKVRGFLSQDLPNILIESHNESIELLEQFRINIAIHNALNPRVDLPSGGYIIIEPTEALTVIDVNSGSFTRSANANETVLWTNCEAAIEIARQLKLRNIGGVVIIDFIDMESRRDQLQLLEYFTEAVSSDAARPQIAQLTELGLVELTRKREGQNIYELFGKPCPNCFGLGHVVSLPGKEQLQPLAAAPGLVRSVAPIRTENSATTEANNVRKRKSGRSRTSEPSLSTIPSSSGTGDELNSDSSETQFGANSSEQPIHRQEPEFIAIPMDLEQEKLYGWLGLNPILLLDSPPEIENLQVRIVRPGEDSEMVLEDARSELAANAGRRRRRGGRGNNKGSIPRISTESNQDSINEVNGTDNQSEEEKVHSFSVEITPLDITQTMNINNAEQEATQNQRQNEETPEDPRRKRRRSSATN